MFNCNFRQNMSLFYRTFTEDLELIWPCASLCSRSVKRRIYRNVHFPKKGCFTREKCQKFVKMTFFKWNIISFFSNQPIQKNPNGDWSSQNILSGKNIFVLFSPKNIHIWACESRKFLKIGKYEKGRINPYNFSFQVQTIYFCFKITQYFHSNYFQYLYYIYFFYFRIHILCDPAAAPN